ncbi:MAG TPA: hypothetical protein VJK29_12820, partial [Terriglobales bacterium]|nr:hypothetical protein [Terriglobales bacterium]
MKYFASPVGQAEHCLSATKLILPACSEASAGPPAPRHNTRYGRVWRFLGFATVKFLVEPRLGYLGTHDEKSGLAAERNEAERSEAEPPGVGADQGG